MVELNDPRLQQVMAQCAPIIEGIDGRLDAISKDIIAIESYLAPKVRDHVKQPITFDLGYEVTGCPELDNPNPFEGPDLLGAGCEGTIERLVLGEFGGRWRLVHVRLRAEGYYALQPDRLVEWTEEHELERRPLIETKADVRLHVADKLPAFVQHVATKFAADRREVYGEESFDDVPL